MCSIGFFLMIRRPPRSTLDRSSAASDVYKRQVDDRWFGNVRLATWVADRQPSSRPVTANSVVFGAVIELMEVVAAPARPGTGAPVPVSYTHLRAHETVLDLVCRLLLEKKMTT